MTGRMPSDNPNYQLLERTPEPSVPPDHPYEHSGRLDFCARVVLRLESDWPVLCGLRRDQHEHSSHTVGQHADA